MVRVKVYLSSIYFKVNPHTAQLDDCSIMFPYYLHVPKNILDSKVLPFNLDGSKYYLPIFRQKIEGEEFVCCGIDSKFVPLTINDIIRTINFTDMEKSMYEKLKKTSYEEVMALYGPSIYCKFNEIFSPYFQLNEEKFYKLKAFYNKKRREML